MKFAKITFYIAFVWGIVILTPLYFMFDMIGRQDPPPITHPGFFYGFVGVGLAWQIAFFIIARDPVRQRPMMIPSILEKFSFVTAMIVLYAQHRIHSSDLFLVAIDGLLGAVFLVAFIRTPAMAKDR
jgi:hypothetical protein